MAEKIGRIIINSSEINLSVKNIAQQILSDNPEKNQLVFVAVLEGAKWFANDLIKEIKKIKNVRIITESVKLSSYKGTESTGNVMVKKDVDGDISGKDVLVVEDIVDTGRTLSFLKDYLLNVKRARSVKICSFTDKPSRRKVDVDIDYLGFKVPDKFIVGYGLDYEQKYRELPYIAEVNVDD